jgi:hypothetical protein
MRKVMRLVKSIDLKDWIFIIFVFFLFSSIAFSIYHAFLHVGEVIFPMLIAPPIMALYVAFKLLNRVFEIV